jgi:hypothetical protein
MEKSTNKSTKKGTLKSAKKGFMKKAETMLKKMKKSPFLTWGALALVVIIGLIYAGISSGGSSEDRAADRRFSVDFASEDEAAEDEAAEDATNTAAQPAGAARSATSARAVTAVENFIYELNKAEDGVIIIGIQKDAKIGAHLVVPAEIEGYPVIAFFVEYGDEQVKARNQPPLQSVVFPDSIIYLGGSGIRVPAKDGDWENLEERYEELAQFANITPTSRNIWGTSFARSPSLKSIVFPKNLKILRGVGFDCPSLKPENITWPEALEAIGNYAFSGNSFTELVIPDGVKIIGEGAFSESATLTSVTIPDSIETIGPETFANCTALTTVKIPTHPIEWRMGITYPFSNDSFLRCNNLRLVDRMAIMDTGYPDF